MTAARGEVDVFVDAIDEAETAQHVALAPISSSKAAAFGGGGVGGTGKEQGGRETKTSTLAASLGLSASEMRDASRRLRRAAALMRARARAAAAATRDAGVLVETGGWPLDAAPTSSLFASAVAAAASAMAGAPPAFSARVGLPGGPFEPPVVSGKMVG